MNKERRFEVILEETRSLGTEVIRIIRDNRTGVQYLFSKSGYGGGVTVLVDRDGKPLLSNIYD